MFYISRKLNDYVYEVTDSKDGVAELYTYNQLIDFVNNGIKIQGIYDDIIVEYSGKSSPYLGVERTDISHPIMAYCRYKKQLKGNKSKVILHRYLYDSEKEMIKEIDAYYNYRVYPNEVIKCFNNMWNYCGEVAVLGEARFLAAPEYSVKFGYPVEVHIRNESSKLYDRIRKGDYLKDKYHYDEKSGIYVYNEHLSELQVDTSYTAYTFNNIGKECYSEHNNDENLLELIKTSHFSANVDIYNNDYFPIKRLIKSSGILYHILTQTGTVLKMNIEDIIEEVKKGNSSYNKYFSINENKLTVISMDGVYEYDIDAIYKVYGNLLSSECEKVELKMKLSGVDGFCRINEKCELIRYYSSSEVINIPNNVKVIKNGSIKFMYENKCMILKPNIEKIEKKAIISTIPDNFTVKVSITNYKVIKQMFQALNQKNLYKSIKFESDSKSDNFVQLYVGCRVAFEYHSLSRNGYIQDLCMSEDKDYFNDEVIQKIVFFMIKNELDNFSWLNEKPKLIVDYKKLPYNSYLLDMSVHSSYRKYYNLYSTYYKIVTELSVYLSSANKTIYLNHIKETKDLLDRNEKEFIQEVLSEYYVDGYKDYR